MVRPNIKSDECPDLDTECEIKWIEIRPNDKDQILIRSFYRPPDSDEKAIQELERSLSKIKSDKRYRNAKIFLGGDFNLGDINWATGGTIPGGRNISQSNILINVLNNFYLEQINDLLTRNDRILNLMITSHPTLVTRTTTCPPIGKSDHDILSVSTNISPRISKQRSRSVPNYEKANWEGIKQDLISSRDKFIAKFESGTHMDTIEENWKQFKEAIETCIEKHIPKKKIGKTTTYLG